MSARPADARICRGLVVPLLLHQAGAACHLAGRSPRCWIIEGRALFGALALRGVEVIEVFPTASWTRWHGKRDSRTRAAWTRQGLAALGLEGAPARTNQDQRDAIATAVTARQHTLAMTETMGDIVVPASHWRPAAPTPQPGDRGPQ